MSVRFANVKYCVFVHAGESIGSDKLFGARVELRHTSNYAYDTKAIAARGIPLKDVSYYP